jgi:hypothetical protein
VHSDVKLLYFLRFHFPSPHRNRAAFEPICEAGKADHRVLLSPNIGPRSLRPDPDKQVTDIGISLKGFGDSGARGA